MRSSEFRPTLIKLHYFNVDDSAVAQDMGLKKDRNGRWYLPQYDVSSRKFDLAVSDAIRAFGRPNTVNL